MAELTPLPGESEAAFRARVRSKRRNPYSPTVRDLTPEEVAAMGPTPEAREAWVARFNAMSPEEQAEYAGDSIPRYKRPTSTASTVTPPQEATPIPLAPSAPGEADGASHVRRPARPHKPHVPTYHPSTYGPDETPAQPDNSVEVAAILAAREAARRERMAPKFKAQEDRFRYERRLGRGITPENSALLTQVLNHEIPPFVAFQQFPPLRGQLEQMGIDPADLARQYQPPRRSVTSHFDWRTGKSDDEIRAAQQNMEEAKARYAANAPARAEAAASRSRFQQEMLRRPGGYFERREATQRYGSPYGGNLDRLREAKRMEALQQQAVDIERIKVQAELASKVGQLSDTDQAKYATANELIKQGQLDAAAAILKDLPGFKDASGSTSLSPPQTPVSEIGKFQPNPPTAPPTPPPTPPGANTASRPTPPEPEGFEIQPSGRRWEGTQKEIAQAHEVFDAAVAADESASTWAPWLAPKANAAHARHTLRAIERISEITNKALRRQVAQELLDKLGRARYLMPISETLPMLPPVQTAFRRILSGLAKGDNPYSDDMKILRDRAK